MKKERKWNTDPLTLNLNGVSKEFKPETFTYSDEVKAEEINRNLLGLRLLGWGKYYTKKNLKDVARELKKTQVTLYVYYSFEKRLLFTSNDKNLDCFMVMRETPDLDEKYSLNIYEDSINQSFNCSIQIYEDNLKLELETLKIK